MLYNFFFSYPYVVYSIIGWAYVFVVVKPRNIKILWPMAILSAAILFGSTEWLISIVAYRFNINFLPILGIPLFYIIWGASSGLVYIYHARGSIYKRLVLTILFPMLLLVMEKFVENANRVEHLGKFTDIHQFVFDISILLSFAYLSDNIFRERINRIKKKGP